MIAQPMTASRRQLVLGTAALFVLAGCGSLIGPSGPPPQIYRLAPVLPPAAGGASVSWQLAIARPISTLTLDTERIALVRGETMDYYADAQWNDTVPRLVQSLLVEAFEQSGRIAAVAPESGGLRANYTLATDIRDFDAQYDSANGAPNVVVAIEAKLVGERGNVVASLDARQTARASQNSVTAVVAAFDQAAGAALAQIVTWTLQASPPPPS
ncbi:MAG TPA: ABC-type transport auxiliary lipoprotein family protein [Rhizomicrobium sp.]|jgi:cholesterol transport system auxiliary component|nr:ABC-type transport auxiliary lipoprotein family protein [Rhizomicrobium sp.]